MSLSKTICVGLLFAGAALAPDVIQAQAPVVNLIRPLGVQPGQTVDLRTLGGNLAGAKECWSSFAGTTLVATDVEGNGTDNAQTLYHVAVPADAPLGVHGLRVATGNGVSSLRLLLVDDLPTIAEVGGNQSLSTGQEVAIPAAVDGVVDNLSRDFYKFTAQAGQTLTFEVWGRRLGSPLDPAIFLYTADGRELAYVDDSPGLSSDAQLVYTFAEASQYVVEIRDIQFRGSGNHFYRLRMGDFPALNIPVPAGVTQNIATRIDFSGVQGVAAAPVHLTVPADVSASWWRLSTTRVGGANHNFGQVQVTAGNEVLEHEPNDAAEQAQQIELGSGINGRADQPNDIDRFSFLAKKDERFDFTGMTRELGSPLDLSLRLLNAEGGQVAVVDDAGTAEGMLAVTIPADGAYTLEVRDLQRRGGPTFAYRIAIARHRAEFQLEAGADALTIAAGNVVAVPVSVKRVDYGGEISLSVEGLPAGVTVTPTVIGPGLNSTVLTLEATPEFATGVISQIAIVGTAKIGDMELQRKATARVFLRGQWSNTAIFPGSLESMIALSGAPVRPLQVRAESRDVLQFKRGEKPTVKFIAQRGEGIDEAITLTTNPEKDALPANVGLAMQPIAKDQTEVSLQFDSNANSPLGTFSVVLTATHKKGDVTTVVSTPAFTYRIVE